NYRVVVKDSLGCSDVASINVNVVDFRITNKFPTKDTSICFGQTINLNTNAQIINQRGGPYIFNWNQNNPILSQNNVLNPTASPIDTVNVTEFILTITDLGGCSIKDTLKLSVNRLPKAEIIAPNSTCTGNLVSLTGLASNTVAPYSFAWSEPNNQNSLFRFDTSNVSALPATAQPVASGTPYTYNLVVTDANGCRSNPTSKQIIALLTPILSFKDKNLVGCLGTPLFVDASSPENGTMILSYLWTNGNTSTTQAQKTFTEAGQYVISVTESSTNAGCQRRDTINVRFDRPLSGLNLMTKDQICKNDTLAMYASLAEGDFPINFKWEVLGGIGTFNRATSSDKDNLNDTLVYYPNFNDQPSVTIRVTAKNVCNELIDSKLVLLNEVPIAKIQNAPIEVFVNTPATFTQSSTGFDQLFWNFKDGTAPVQDNSSSISHTYTDNGIYFVTLTATNAGGCTSKDSVRLEVIRNQILFIPNVFSPNAKDLQNQALRVYGMNIQSQDFDFMVFNKWGEVVYETKDYATAYLEGWNGKFKNTGNDQAIGVYTYSVRGKFLDGSKFEKVGTVTLLR
ncbi:MAG: PKD domain-containing protein, partial [Cytophagales bacterium]